MTVAELIDILNDFSDDCIVYINDSSQEIRDVFSGFNSDDDEEYCLIV